MKDKIKQISKYVMNIMAFINALLVELSPIWGWQIDKITKSMTILVGLIGVWLVTGKIFGDKDEDIHGLVEDHEVE